MKKINSKVVYQKVFKEMKLDFLENEEILKKFSLECFDSLEKNEIVNFYLDYAYLCFLNNEKPKKAKIFELLELDYEFNSHFEKDKNLTLFLKKMINVEIKAIKEDLENA